VAYATTPDLDSAVFATQKATRKYRLLSECAHVALVIDNRSALPGQLMDVEAVTATGHAHEVATGPELKQWSRLLTDGHPYLDEFVRSASCGLFRVDFGASTSRAFKRSGSGFPEAVPSPLVGSISPHAPMPNSPRPCSSEPNQCDGGRKLTGTSSCLWPMGSGRRSTGRVRRPWCAWHLALALGFHARSPRQE
jgi:hypothetical protein